MSWIMNLSAVASNLTSIVNNGLVIGFNATMDWRNIAFHLFACGEASTVAIGDATDSQG